MNGCNVPRQKKGTLSEKIGRQEYQHRRDKTGYVYYKAVKMPIINALVFQLVSVFILVL
jgi:hypothetical protein